MIISIKGVGTVNKGAYLMLLSVLDHYQDKPIAFVSHPNRNFSLHAIKSLGMQPLFKSKKRGIELRSLIQLLPLSLRKKMGLLLEEDVDVILNASGFVYGDQWSANFIKGHLSDKILHYNKKGIKTIILPQAFGPFKNEAIRYETKKVIDQAAAVYVRDSQSLKMLNKHFPKCENLKPSPDFTCLLKPNSKRQFDAETVLLVPNFKLIDKTETGEAAIYDFFKNMIQHIASKGKSASFLIHEGKRDEAMAIEINKLLDKPIPILIEPDPIQQKAIIAGAYAVISARFHALVSSLSQEIPSLALSWSHKYAMLLADYKQDDFLLTMHWEDDISKLTQVLSQSNNQKIRGILRQEAVLQRTAVVKMWKEIDALILNE